MIATGVLAICRLLRPRIANAGLLLTIRKPPYQVILYPDERILKQMLLNLLSNACKFTPPDGRIECGVSIDAAGIAFAVSDTGIVFRRKISIACCSLSSKSTARRAAREGTGLGLALVSEMAKLNGGTLHLQSEPGAGTDAVLVLPLERLRSDSAGAESAVA